MIKNTKTVVINDYKITTDELMEMISYCDGYFKAAANPAATISDRMLYIEQERKVFAEMDYDTFSILSHILDNNIDLLQFDSNNYTVNQFAFNSLIFEINRLNNVKVID